jgi:hypothetical protein
MGGAAPAAKLTSLTKGTVSATGSRRRESNELLERQETLLAVTGQVGDPLYNSTGRQCVH